MTELNDFMKKYKNFENIEITQYNDIKLVKIKLSNDNKSIIFIPGYSFASFSSMFIIINNNFEIIKKNYNILYFIVFDTNIKKKSNKIVEGVDDIKEQYKINEKFRIELANEINNIIKKKKINNFTLLGKSAGGGIAVYISKKNKQVKNLFLICPGMYKSNIKLNKEIKIVLCWNIDDDKIPYNKSLEFVKNYIKNKNNFLFLSFEKGGHELNENFFIANIY
jgi:pimeloyl-ACP methyl ester carboxylesterase